MPSVQRRLQAIMFTDIKGYSAMMGADEATTIRAVREHRDVVRAVLARHEGREQRIVGDAFLVLFDSAVHAVRCAIEIQETFVARNASLPPVEQLWLRIGVHAGDVVIEDDGQIAGDAVNVAARVEPLAPPGGVCVTDVVAVQARPNMTRPLEPMAPVPMKNIARPPQLFRIVVAPLPTAPRRAPWRALVASGAALVLVTLALAVWQWRTGLPASSRPVLVSSDPVAQQRFEDALEAFRHGDSRAAALAVRARDADPKSAYAHLLVSVTARATEAEEARDRAASIVEGQDDPQARLVRLVVASVREQDGGVGVHNGSELVAELDAWAAANHGDAFGSFLRAANYPMHGAESDFHGADPDREHLDAVEMRRFLADHPDWTVARIDLVQRQSPAHDADAPALLEEGLERCPECAGLRVALGRGLLGRRRLDEARGQLRRALERDPAILGAREGLASIALRQGDEVERARLEGYLLAPEVPPGARAEFAAEHGLDLVMAGRVRDGVARLELAAETYEAAGELDGVVRPWLHLAGQLVVLDELPRARQAVDRIERWVVRPELGDAARDLAGLATVALSGDIAWQERDVAGVRASLERMRRIPPGRVEAAQLTPAIETASQRVAVLEGDVRVLEQLDRLTYCGSYLQRGQYQAYLGDPDAAAELRHAIGEDCEPDTVVRVRARLALAELAVDPPERAEHVAAALALWPQADPDLVVVQRLAALASK